MQLTKQQRIYIVLYLLEKHGRMNKAQIDRCLDELGFGTSHTDQYTTMDKKRWIVDDLGRWTITDSGREQLHLLFMRMFPVVMRVLRATDISN